jgi:hypothetical protein
MGENLSKNQLIKLVTDIINANGTENEIDSWISTFKNNVPYPNVSDLIFYPDRVPGIEQGKELTTEEIVDIALEYKPILL